MPVREGPPQPAPPPRDEARQPPSPAGGPRGGAIQRTPIRPYFVIGALILLMLLVLLLLQLG